MKSISGSLVVFSGASLFGAMYCSNATQLGNSAAIVVPLLLMVIGLAIIFISENENWPRSRHLHISENEKLSGTE